jgi:hypothetical protein
MSEVTGSVVDAARAWLEIDGVEGIAEGSLEGQPCVVVLTSSSPQALQRRLPARILGLPVIVRHSRAFSRGAVA